MAMKNKHGEVANLTVNANVNIRNAKEKDLNTLKSLTEKDLEDIALSMSEKPDMEVLKTALSEMIASAEKNLSADMAERTNQSKAQTEAYIHICPSVKLHKDTMNIFVEGFINNKTVIVEGEYPVKNKREKTKCKDAIGKHCDLSMNKYRMYNVGSINSIKMTGNTLQIL